jgi:hypothetical protein
MVRKQTDVHLSHHAGGAEYSYGYLAHGGIVGKKRDYFNRYWSYPGDIRFTQLFVKGISRETSLYTRAYIRRQTVTS